MQPAPIPPCVCARLRRASRALTRLYDDALASAGLTVTQFSILRNSQRLDGPTLNELAAQTGHERSALWRTLQPLARQGLIEFSAGKDERTRRVRVTAAGADLIEQATPLWRSSQEKVHLRLGEERRRALIGLLREVESLV